jgi:hypothetical protein
MGHFMTGFDGGHPREEGKESFGATSALEER